MGQSTLTSGGCWCSLACWAYDSNISLCAHIAFSSVIKHPITFLLEILMKLHLGTSWIISPS